MEKRTDILFITGPTGGHFFPALSLAEEVLEKTDLKIKFVIPKRENLIGWLRRKKIPFFLIPEAKLSKKNFLTFPFLFKYASLVSFNIIIKEKPEVVVGTGSYVSVPFITVSKFLKRKILLHEQNFIPGKATRILSMFADKIGLTFPDKDRLPLKKCVITGMPVLKEFRKIYEKERIIKEFGLQDNKITVLIMGGSQGAGFINRLILQNITYLRDKPFQFIHLAGKEKKSIEEIYLKEGINGKIFDFYYDMGIIYSVTDIAICRAGAGTITELVANRIPAILIPYPYAGAHQKENAEFLKNHGGCLVAQQSEETEKNFISIFEKLVLKRREMVENLKKVKLVDDEGNLFNILISLIKK